MRRILDRLNQSSPWLPWGWIWAAVPAVLTCALVLLLAKLAGAW